MNKIKGALIMGLGIALFQTNVLAKLLITPTRIDLNSQNKVQSLKLINESEEEVTYRIEYMYQNMMKNGTYLPAAEESKLTMQEIEQFIMYSPRQVTLAPKQTQTVRFALRKKEGMKDGEYNAHVLFREVETRSQVAKLDANNTDKNNFSIEIKPLFNIAIPVFVSSSLPGKFSATLDNVLVDKEKNAVVFNITNMGTQSPYGNIVARFYKGRKVLTEEFLNGVSITMPLKTRTITLEYDETKFNENEITSVEVSYSSSPELAKSYTIAEGKIEIQ